MGSRILSDCLMHTRRSHVGREPNNSLLPMSKLLTTSPSGSRVKALVVQGTSPSLYKEVIVDVPPNVVGELVIREWHVHVFCGGG